MTLYQSVLGEDFDFLAPVLQRFHGAAGGARARGTLKVERGRGPLARFACLCMGAPAPGDAVPDWAQGADWAWAAFDTSKCAAEPGQCAAGTRSVTFHAMTDRVRGYP